MEIGLFLEFPRLKQMSETQAFDQSFDLITTAENLNINSVWLAELPFEPERSVLSTPVVVATAAACKTSRIRIGLAVAVLPLYDPIRLAEEMATLDHISHGRLEFGIGRSASPQGYIGYNVPYNESRERFFECLEVIKKAWTDDSLCHQGRFYSYDKVRISPKPFQKPFPPIRLATNSPETYLIAGKLGVDIFISVRGLSSALEERVSSYKEAWVSSEHSGDPQISLRVPVYVADTMEKALAEPEESAINFYQRLRETVGSPIPGLSEEENYERAQRGKRFDSLTYDDLLKTDLVFGTPEYVTERLLQLREKFSLSCIIAEPNFGRLVPYERVLRSLNLFASRVAPELV